MIYQLRLISNLNDRDNRGRFEPFVATHAVPSRSWAKSEEGERWSPINDVSWEPDDSPDHKGAPYPMIGDYINILIGANEGRAELVHLYTVFSRALDSHLETGASPFLNQSGRTRCVIDLPRADLKYWDGGMDWWQFRLGCVRILDRTIKHHFEMSVGAIVKVRGSYTDPWQYGHDPEMVVDGSNTP